MSDRQFNPGIMAAAAVVLFAAPVAVQYAMRDEPSPAASPPLMLEQLAAGERPWWETIEVEVDEPDAPADPSTPAGPTLTTFTVPSDFSFAPGSAELTPAGVEALLAILPELNGATVIEVAGCTDHRGSPDYNLDLGQQRADAVAALFAANGVPVSVVQTTSWGATRPVERRDGQPEEEWLAANRRVVITVTTVEAAR